jgi:lysophospholipase L1-like esterase
VGAPAAFLALVELSLALLGLPRARQDPNFAEMVRSIDAQEFYYEVDPELFWKLRPQLAVAGESTFIRTNSSGFRSGETPRDKPPGTCRLLLIGDSVTFGYGVPESVTFAARLRKRLADRFPDRPIDVVNAGVPGYSSQQGFLLLRRIIGKLKPDVVVASFGFNDARDMFASDAEVLAVGRSTLALRRVLHRFRLYRLLRSWFVPAPRTLPSGRAPVARVSPAEYAANLRALADLSERAGATIIFLAPPFQLPTQHPYGPRWFTLAHPLARYRRQMELVGAEVGAELVRVPDLTEESAPENARFFLDAAHPNADGHALVADSLVAVLGRVLGPDGSPSADPAPPGR